MSRVGDDSGTPRAIVHKKILDVAASDPDASMEAIASEVSGASIDLVERVLDEYGDPCEEPATDAAAAPDEQPTRTTTETMAEPEPVRDEPDESDEPNEPAVNRSDLSDKQLDTLRAIAANPDCSQAELAEEFDVTRATISRWVNDIPGFEWSRRHEIATRILGAGDGGGNRNGNGNGNDPDDGDRATRGNGDGGGTVAGPSTAGTEPTDPDADPDGEGVDGEAGGDAPSADPEAIEELRDRLADLERRIDGRGTTTGDEPSGGERANTPIEPDLAHRVVHACMGSDRITEAEELRLLELFMGAGDD